MDKSGDFEVADSYGQFLGILADSSIFNVHDVLRNGRFSKKWLIPRNWQEESATSKSPLLAV